MRKEKRLNILNDVYNVISGLIDEDLPKKERNIQLKEVLKIINSLMELFEISHN